MHSAIAPDKGGVDDLTKEFLAESIEGLDRVDQCLTELETRPADAELLGEIFRAVHTIKGATGFLGLGRLERLAHAGEYLLGRLRDGAVKATPTVISGLLQLMDGLRAILSLIERTGGEGVRRSDDDVELIARLKELEDADAVAAPAGETLEHLILAELEMEARAGEAKAKAKEENVVTEPASSSPVSAEKTLRVDVDVLNRMMNLVGELVLTRNQMLQTQADAANFPELARRLDTVTVDIRETVMRARMQPVGHLFGKFPRMVRDVARSCGKQVRMEFYGQETGLDKSLLEAIKDPLTHALRNSIDHGIEAPREREAAGKPAEGVVTMRAFHRGGSVVVEVVDDGAGIRPERVLAKAVERGLVTEEAAALMEPRQMLDLIFLPGFSTSEQVTHVSGRGVGMDVVRSNVEKVGGTVEMESEPGKGTLLRLRVPLTLAIVPALVVRSGGQSFCLPQGALAELAYVPGREAATAVENIGGARFYRLRDRLLPMVWLDEMLGLERVCAGADCGFYLAVLEADGCRFGLVVDDLMAPEEIVVKPLAAVLREIGLFSGATVLGSGLLAMILDIPATAARAGIKAATERAAAAPVLSMQEAQPSFLIYEDREENEQRGRVERKGMPLSVVERIESVALNNVEFAKGRPLVQYRGELLALEDEGGVLDELLAAGTEEFATVLICRWHQGAARVGVVVRRVVDFAGGSLVEDHTASDRMAIVNERLTVMHRDAVLPSMPMLREVA